MTRLLALETSGSVGSVALLVGEALLERHIATPREQTDLILEHVHALLGEAGIGLAKLDAIAFGRGPGSFTGLRVSTAVAQGLGLALEIPLLPISSLAAIAQGVWRQHGAARTLVCVDARMSEVFWAEFLVSDGLAGPIAEERLSGPNAVVVEAAGEWIAAGSGFVAYPDVLGALASAATQVLGDAEPAARDIVPLALAALESGGGCTVEHALPAYLRREDAWQR